MIGSQISSWKKLYDLVSHPSGIQNNAPQWLTQGLQVQRSLLSKTESVLGRSKSVYQQRNLGTIRARKIEKKQSNATSGEMILRILRMQ